MLARLLRIGILSVGILSVAGTIAFAGENGPAAPNRADFLDKVALLLDLNAGQKVQVQQVLEEQHQQLQTQRKSVREQAQSSGQRPDFEQLRTQRAQAEKELIDKLRPVLADVQLKKFEALRELTRGGPPRRERRALQ